MASDMPKLYYLWEGRRDRALSEDRVEFRGGFRRLGDAVEKALFHAHRTVMLEDDALRPCEPPTVAGGESDWTMTFPLAGGGVLWLRIQYR